MSNVVAIGRPAVGSADQGVGRYDVVPKQPVLGGIAINEDRKVSLVGWSLVGWSLVG